MTKESGFTADQYQNVINHMQYIQGLKENLETATKKATALVFELRTLNIEKPEKAKKVLSMAQDIEYINSALSAALKTISIITSFVSSNGGLVSLQKDLAAMQKKQGAK